MAKLRRNHTSKGTGIAGGAIVKVSIFTAIIAAIVYFFSAGAGALGGAQEADVRVTEPGGFLPTPTGGAIVRHQGFTLSYNEEWEQAEWVAYTLERENLNQPWSKRNDRFGPDPQVKTGSADDYDYRGSGYDRGHLAPFADFAWNEELARETFYMSNISPQARQFNQGVWRELEELTRDWAKKFKRLYVVTGPIMTQDPKGTIGRNTKVAIPVAYFKVLLDLDEPERKGIGFVIPNEISFDPLPKYAMSIDEVESIADIDFFPELMADDVEAALESIGNPDLWPFSKKKYDKRIKNWNNVND